MKREDEIDVLMQIIKDEKLEFFRNKEDANATYTIVPSIGDRRLIPIEGQDFHRTLRHLARKTHPDYIFKTSNIRAVAEQLAAVAHFEPEGRAIHTRIACVDQTIYLDLCDESGRVVVVKPSGWKVVPCPSEVQFRRPAGLLPLPEPVKGGDLDSLKPLINIEQDDWPLLMGYLVGCLKPWGAQPIGMFTGSQGDGKSTVCKMVRRLIDPHTTQVQARISSERDLVIAAQNCQVMAFDNLSSISNDESDTLCRLATGAGFRKRRLYTDDQEYLVYMQNPVLINSINEIPLRGDLSSRTIRFRVPRLKKRVPENELWDEFERVHGGVLGCLLDAAVEALKMYQEVSSPDLPRLADLVRFVTAAEPALGLKTGAFRTALEQMNKDANFSVVEANPVGSVLLDWARKRRKFEGTTSQILSGLNEACGKHDKDARDWPRTARGLTPHLQRLKGSLKGLGVDIEFLPRRKDARRIRVTFTEPAKTSTNNTTGKGGSADNPGKGVN